MNARSAGRYAEFACSPPSQHRIDGLQDEWDSAGELRAEISGPAEVMGDTAEVLVRLAYNGRSQGAKMPLQRQGSTWCIDES